MARVEDSGFSPIAGAVPGGSRAAARCQVWGVLNVTPDSFSDGGQHDGLDAACAHARAMVAAGADVIDVGGESTRPAGTTYGVGAAEVCLEEELRRVVPVVERLAGEGVVLSVDTTKAQVASACVNAGARIVNDVSMGRSDALLRVVAESGAEVVLMHNRARGARDCDNAHYADVSAEALAELRAAVDRAVKLGVARERVWIDPGLGFAKGPGESLKLMADLGRWAAIGHRVLVGASRKSFLAEGGGAPGTQPTERLGGSIAAALAADASGCAAVRVHDVFETVQALSVAAAVRVVGANA